MLWILGLPLLIGLFTGLYLKLNPQFGGSVADKDRGQYRRSGNWDGNQFVNIEHTALSINLKTLPGLLKEQFTNTKARSPEKPLPVQTLELERFQKDIDTPKFVWYGHSAVLLQINGKNLLIDPMLGPDTSPVAPFTAARFSENTLSLLDKLPPIDAVLLTHDHYDHLDYVSFKKWQHLTDTFFVALGVGRRLRHWGLAAEQIKEFDWWDSIDFEGIKITFTPSRHFSGRGMFDRNRSLWGGWAFNTAKHNIYWSGDGGYGKHFKEVGEKLGPFDWAFVECGQYNWRWHQIHMYPEESLQAAADAKADIAIPVHWGAFALALHPWKEPIERFTAEAGKKNAAICTPMLGEIINMGDEAGRNWWKDLD